MDFDSEIISQIENLTKEKHPLIQSPECFTKLLVKIEDKKWDWVLECRDASFIMRIFIDSFECIGMDKEINRAVYIAYFDALTFDNKQ
jgi:hypothetical protein